MLARYHRGGGDRPRDDESLEIAEDGSFVLTRVVGGPRVGTFAGTITKQARAALASLAAKAEDFEDRPRGLPPHVIESVTTSRADITVGARTKASGPATKLVKRMRQLSDDLTASPVAALELRVGADGRSLTLASVGTDAVEVDFRTASVTFTLFGEREELLTAGEIDGLDAQSRVLAPGWSTDLAIVPELDFNPRRTLDVKVEFDLLGEDRTPRRARLAAIAGRGWT